MGHTLRFPPIMTYRNPKFQLGPLRATLALCVAALSPACSKPAPQGPGWVVTIHPLQMIVAKISPPEVPIAQLLTPGASPHSHEPSARDAVACAESLGLLFVDDSLDAWAAGLPATRRIAVGAFLPEELRLGIHDVHHHGHHHDHHHPEGDFNAHFWTDPLAVAAVVPALAEAMAAADPERAAVYRARAGAFVSELEALSRTLEDRLQPLAGAAIAQFHPSWDYLFHRHNLRAVGLIEPAPGKEASPRYLRDLIALLRKEEVRVILTEPQLPVRPAEVVAEATGAKIIELDPVGGARHADPDYAAWLLRQVDRLRGAL